MTRSSGCSAAHANAAAGEQRWPRTPAWVPALGMETALEMALALAQTPAPAPALARAPARTATPALTLALAPVQVLVLGLGPGLALVLVLMPAPTPALTPRLLPVAPLARMPVLGRAREPGAVLVLVMALVMVLVLAMVMMLGMGLVLALVLVLPMRLVLAPVRTARRIAGLVHIARARTSKGRNLRAHTVLATVWSLHTSEHPPRSTARAQRREIRCPRLTSAARLGPVLVGLLNTFRGDAAG